MTGVLSIGTDPYELSKTYVLDSLKAPATAKFPPKDKIAVEKTNQNTYAILAYVDAQNSFGALIRQYYGCELVDNQGTWSCIFLNIGDNISSVIYDWSPIRDYTTKDNMNDTITTTGDSWKIEWSLGGTDYSNPYITPYPFLMVSIDDQNGPTGHLIYSTTPYASGTEYINEGAGRYTIKTLTMDLTFYELKVSQGTCIFPGASSFIFPS